MKILRMRRPSASLVVASLALLVALSGTSIASVTGVPRFSVGPLQLKKNAVTTPKIKNRAVTLNKLALGARIPGPKGDKGDKGDPGVATPGFVAQVVSQSSASVTTTSAQAFQELPGATENVVVPSGETARLYALFSGESSCYGGTGNCSVRITVDGNELQPVEGATAYFDSTDAGNEGSNSVESHAIVRISDTLNAGTHAVKVERRTTQAATTLRLDDWALVIFRTKVS